MVVSIKDGRATIGVQQPSSDPHIETFDDPDLTGLAQEALAVIERGQGQMGGRTQVPRSRQTRSPRPGRRTRSEHGTAQASTAEGGGGAAARDAEAVLRVGAKAE